MVFGSGFHKVYRQYRVRHFEEKGFLCKTSGNFHVVVDARLGTWVGWQQYPTRRHFSLKQ